jgi:hypothetical protein
MRVSQTAHRLMWFVALWAGGVLSVTAVSYAIRWAILK